jgi:hypothetical protein
LVAVIHSSASLRSAVNYNEHKVKEGKAELLLAVNYPKDALDLTFHQKLGLLTRRAALNTRATVKSVHISLNFDVSEKLPRAILEQIASRYMTAIGFGEQPFLVYQHRDSGHPHLHIVTTNIREDGKRISLHNLGKLQSEPARKAIEIEFKLTRASGKQLSNAYQVQPVNVTKVLYGKIETRRAISYVVSKLITDYKFSSLPEFNALLQQYNVLADRGTETSRTFARHGLVYRLLDEKGNKVGVPIKASRLPGKPTLKLLEQQFAKKSVEKSKLMQRTRTRIDWILSHGGHRTLDHFSAALQQENITLVKRLSKDGRVFGLTYIDFNNRCVFNGSDLGKQYAAKAILGTGTSVLQAPHEKNIVQAAQLSIPFPASMEISLPPSDNTAPAASLTHKKKRKKRTNHL